MTTTPETRLEDLIAKLRARDCRMTPQRLALLRILTATRDHLSPAQLYARLKVDYPTMSPGTVYKTLALLKEMGEANELGFSDDDNRYDVRDPQPHAHLICTRCRKIIDAEVNLPPELLQAAPGQTGFAVTGHRLDFYGLCSDCREEV